MKVKIFNSNNYNLLETRINEFIMDKMTIDIRFQTIVAPDKKGNNTISYVVLISYEDFEECELLKSHKVTAEDILGEAFWNE